MLTILLEFLRDTPPEGSPGIFGPAIRIADTARPLDRILGLAGRDPAWAR
ncbi:hypothetical protein [Nocardia sp. NPDC049707]